MGGNVSGLNHTGDVPSAIQTPSAQVMESAYETVLVIALGIIEELTAQYACQKSDAQAMGTVTLTGSAIVTMAGQGNHSTAAFVHQRLSAVVTGRVTTTTKPTKTSLVFAMTISLDKIAAKHAPLWKVKSVDYMAFAIVILLLSFRVFASRDISGIALLLYAWTLMNAFLALMNVFRPRNASTHQGPIAVNAPLLWVGPSMAKPATTLMSANTQMSVILRPPALTSRGDLTAVVTLDGVEKVHIPSVLI